jgi:hypothetical protein
MPLGQKKKFFKARAISSRLPTAPEMLTLPEVQFYTGVSLRAVRNWTREWQVQNLAGQKKLAWQIAGPGSAWTVRRLPLIAWLISEKHVKPDASYGFPDPETAGEYLIALVDAAALTAKP